MDADWAELIDDLLRRMNSELMDADATTEVLWLQIFLCEIDYPQNHPLDVKYPAHNPLFHSRMKHMTMSFYFIRELVRKGILQVTHIAAIDELADNLRRHKNRLDSFI